jgi:hypothetical protein
MMTTDRMKHELPVHWQGDDPPFVWATPEEAEAADDLILAMHVDLDAIQITDMLSPVAFSGPHPAPRFWKLTREALIAEVCIPANSIANITVQMDADEDSFEGALLDGSIRWLEQRLGSKNEKWTAWRSHEWFWLLFHEPRHLAKLNAALATNMEAAAILAAHGRRMETADAALALLPRDPGF